MSVRLKTVYFYNIRLSLFPCVYNPHYETEMIFELLDIVFHPDFTIVEIGTGSAALILAIESRYKIERTDALFGYEISRIAYSNSLFNSLCSKSRNYIMRADIFKISSLCCDIIICNPPYIKTSIIPASTRHGMRIALDGGPDGLNFINKLLSWRVRYVILEVGYEDQIIALMSNNAYEIVKISKPIHQYEVFFILLSLRNSIV